MRLAACGYGFYEVSNACRDGLRSRHNSAYWSGRAYLGLGPAAHSFDGRVRRWNLPAWEAYRRAVAARRPVVEAEEVLTDEQRELESLYLALRTAAGMPLAALCRGAQCEVRSEEHTSELQSRFDLVCRLLLEKKKQKIRYSMNTFH